MKKLLFILAITTTNSFAQQTQKPPLHAKNWMAITGKPLAATAGATIFNQGGNAIDASCAMLAACCTMFDVLSWGGETQALIYNPKTKKVIAINALGVAPTGATVEFFKSKGYEFPPEYGPLAAVTPGTPGGLCYMLANYGTMSLQQVLKPAMELAAGYPIEAQTANSFERSKKQLKEWAYSKKIFLPHLNEKREAPEAGEIFVQKDLLATLTKMIDAEIKALQQKKSRKEAIMAAYNEFYTGSIAKEFVRSCQEQGGLITLDDLKKWKVKEEEPLVTNYKGIDVHKLQTWTQGATMLQALNILENADLQKMKYNSAEYINTIYQTMSLTFADRDFYYGDPAFSKTPIKGLLSKEYAKQRFQLINKENNILFTPGNPYPYQGETINPFENYLQQHNKLTDSNYKQNREFAPKHDATNNQSAKAPPSEGFGEAEESLYQNRLWLGTTTVEAADKEGWIVTIVPSGGWNPACIAGNTGVGMSQRMQSFVLDSAINPFNVVAPGKQPRVTLTPTLCLKGGKPFLSFGVQGGDTQEQNSLQFFLNIVEFGMTIQQATEAANINTNQLWLSLGGTKLNDRKPRAGNLLLQDKTPENVRATLKAMGYKLSFDDRTSGPLNGIYFDWKHNTMWGGSSNHGEDYGIGW
jgi:gamma-glutamyltranspeptidase / glutathione hydrolase